MNILYIGIYEIGSTSRMRGEILAALNPKSSVSVIDTSIPFESGLRILKSVAFRYKIGPLIGKINKYVISEIAKLNQNNIDLIWVDKAVYLAESTTKTLRSKTSKLVHYTPDPAFTFHQSRYFKASLPYYDYAITTKAYELEFFQRYLKPERVIYATQGFDKRLHRPQTPLKSKKNGLLFIGHKEREREIVLQTLIDNQISVSIAGIKWEAFIKKNKSNPHLIYLGKGIYGADYAKILSSYQFSWGSLSKWIPELHTTRTFEIPACGTALITERNSETQLFFNEDEAIFYDNLDEMIEKIKTYQNNLPELEILTQKGLNRVNSDGRDYESIIKNILGRIKST